jgi:hypothetical protein
MNTYTDKQLSNAVAILDDIWSNEPSYKELPTDSKNKLAEIVLRVFKIEPKP